MDICLEVGINLPTFLLYSLNVTMYVLMFILNLFPIAWIAARLGGGLDRFGEPLNMFCNFAAKVRDCGAQEGEEDLCQDPHRLVTSSDLKSKVVISACQTSNQLPTAAGGLQLLYSVQ